MKNQLEILGKSVLNNVTGFMNEGNNINHLGNTCRTLPGNMFGFLWLN